MVAKEKVFNLCISILEFKGIYKRTVSICSVDLCISILEFKG